MPITRGNLVYSCSDAFLNMETCEIPNYKAISSGDFASDIILFPAIHACFQNPAANGHPACIISTTNSGSSEIKVPDILNIHYVQMFNSNHLVP